MADAQLSPDVLKVLRAMSDLGSGPNTVGEIAAASGVDRITVDRRLKEFEAGTKPRAVRCEVDKGISETVWFLQVAGAEFMEHLLEGGPE
jgi:DNA-binding MarR family transcriptional regulator